MNIIEKKSSLLTYLPAIYQEEAKKEEDPLRTLLIIFDYFYSGIEKKIDNFDTYFDPYLTDTEPDKKSGIDFLSWLASWVNLRLDEGWSERKKRYLIKNAATLYRHRGTLIGLKYIIEQFFDIEVEIEEWAWPQGMEIGRRSSIGIDTTILERIDIRQCFKVIWKPPYPPVKPEFLKKIRTIMDLEKPDHTKCYFQLKLPEEIMPEIEPMIVGLNSTIGSCYINGG
jgi:phage tail-like protein